MQSVPMQVPLIGQQQRPSHEEMMRAQVQQAMNQLSLGIYAQLAAAHIVGIDVHQDIDAEKMRVTAQRCSTAARCYFEGLGIVKFED